MLMPGMGKGWVGTEGERQKGQGGQGKAGKGHCRLSLSGSNPKPILCGARMAGKGFQLC
jgi:hypothetical protein